MKLNPSPRWTHTERLQVIAEITSHIIDNQLASVHYIALRVMNDIKFLAQQPDHVLEDVRSKILSLSYAMNESTGAKRMTITTQVQRELIDGSESKLCQLRVARVPLPPGCYRFERIANPFSCRFLRTSSDFLVREGTKYGFAESYWRTLEVEANVRYRVVIEEEIDMPVKKC